MALPHLHALLRVQLPTLSLHRNPTTEPLHSPLTAPFSSSSHLVYPDPASSPLHRPSLPSYPHIFPPLRAHFPPTSTLSPLPRPLYLFDSCLHSRFFQLLSSLWMAPNVIQGSMAFTSSLLLDSIYPFVYLPLSAFLSSPLLEHSPHYPPLCYHPFALFDTVAFIVLLLLSSPKYKKSSIPSSPTRADLLVVQFRTMLTPIICFAWLSSSPLRPCHPPQ